MSLSLNYQTKLTAVTASHNGRKVQMFVQCYMINGKAFLTGDMVTAIETKLNVRHGDAYTIG